MKRNIVRLCLGIFVLALTFFISGPRSSAHENDPIGGQRLAGVREDVQGELEVIAECENDRSRTIYNLKSGGKTFSLRFAKGIGRNLTTGMKVRVRGIRSGDEISADDIVTQDLGGSSTASAAQGAASSLTNTTGDHKVAVILVNFQDDRSEPYTPAQAQDVAFNTTSNFYRENSYGQTSLSGDVFGWFTIPISSANCDTAMIAAYAQQAVSSAGASLSAYDHLVYAFPATSACSFTGRANVGGSPGQVWVNGWFELDTLAHELGHNFGLYHSRSMDCGAAVIGGTCTTDEYGDTFDMMGASGSAHFNSFQKERLGWLNSGGSPPIQTITAGGTYWIDAYETLGSGVKALKILRSTDPATGLKTWYYLEHRTPTGFDGFLANLGAQSNGVILRTGAESSGQETYLLDVAPATSTWNDAFLVPGQSFSDPSNGMSLTTVSADSSGAWVQVTLGSQACSHFAPGVSVSPGKSQWLRSGASFAYSVAVKNNDSSGCSPANFTLQNSVPAGWSSSYSSPSVAVAPGSTAVVSLNVTSPAGAADGSYSVAASAVNGTYSGSSTAAYTIVSSLGLNLRPGASTYARTQKAGVTATLSAGGSVLPGTVVTFTMTRPNGSSVTQSATTGSDGTAAFSYTFNKRSDPLGVYQVKAVSSSNGLTGQGTTSFAVNK